MRKTCGLKVRIYANGMIDLNEYLYDLPGVEASEKIVRCNWMKYC